jgi:hypothetical protein
MESHSLLDTKSSIAPLILFNNLLADHHPAGNMEKGQSKEHVRDGWWR